MTLDTYTSNDIKVLSDFEHCRLRTNVYLGNTNVIQNDIPLLIDNKFTIKTMNYIPAIYKAVGEIIDNCLDEHNQNNVKNKTITIIADTEKGIYDISDNGRGVPIDIHATGKHTPEVVFGTLRSGRNFDDDQKQIGIMGVNGVGSSVTNACSEEFEVTIHRDRKKYYQKFSKGASVISKPKITAAGSSTGTQIRFKLDPLVFKHIALPDEMMHSKAIEIAMTNPGITVEYNGNKYKFRKGLIDIINKVTNNKSYYCFNVSEANIQGQIYLIPNAHTNQEEVMFTWVNSSLLLDGGKCNTQFFNVLFDQTINHLEKQAKKTKTEVTRNDVRHGLMVLADLKIKNPEYDSQAKTRLTGPDLRKEFTSCVDNNWRAFCRTNSDWFEQVLARAQERHHSSKDKKAINDHQKNISKRIEGLLDAIGKDRSKCQLLITEGLSAKGKVCESRNPETTGAIALTGKINNVYGCTPAQMLSMGKISDLLAAIGLVPGKRADRSQLKFGRVVIATDADYDGDDIFTLLVNLFYQWPELFDPKQPAFVYRLVAPNVVASKNGTRVHFTTRTDFEKQKSKYSSWNIQYMKGLGSMNKEDWEIILSKETDSYIPIIDDGQLKQTLQLLFSENIEARKQWLTK